MAYLIKNRIFSNEQVNPLPVQQKQVRCLMSDSRTRESTKGAGDETLINNSCLSSNGKEGSLKVHLLFSELIFVSDKECEKDCKVSVIPIDLHHLQLHYYKGFGTVRGIPKITA